jgi:hypothetical protein
MSDKLHISIEWLKAVAKTPMSLVDYEGQYEVLRPFVLNEFRDAHGIAPGQVTGLTDYPVIYTIVKTGEDEYTNVVLGLSRHNIGGAEPVWVPRGHFTVLESYTQPVVAFFALMNQMVIDQNFEEEA